MLRGVRWLALAGVVATAALVGPTAALACDGSGSATSIYSECVPKASGGHPTKHPAKPSQPPGQTTPWVAPVQPVVHVSPKTHRALVNSGKDRKPLTNLVRNPGLVQADRLNSVLASAPTRTTTLGSAFDLGAGPTILFALLAGTVLLLLGTGGVRSWRNRHRV